MSSTDGQESGGQPPQGEDPQPQPAAASQSFTAPNPSIPYAIPHPGHPMAGGPLLLPMLQQAQLQMWQGQFPPPAALREYESILPGSFDRLMRMAERQQDSQFEEVRRAQEFSANDVRRGHWLGFVATALAILAATVCVIAGVVWKESGAFWVAASLVAVPVMAVAKSLIETTKAPVQLPPAPVEPTSQNDGG